MFKHINAQELKNKMAEQTVVLVDIRDPQSYANGHLPGAILINNDNVAQFMADTPNDSCLVVCCYHGNSSQGAAQYFYEQGFQDVYSLDGGFEFWRSTEPDAIEL